MQEPQYRTPEHNRALIPPTQHTSNIALYLVLTLITFGLFNIYWNYRQMKSCNALVGRDEFSFFWWAVLVVVTFGIYHFYYQFKMGRAINDIQRKYRLDVTEGLPILSLLAAILGVGVVADCIHQHELNRIEASLLQGGARF